MSEKRFTIDVEIEHYENAYFENDKFLCYEDDYDAILKRLNELAEENEQLKSELQHIYQIATIKKVEEIVEKVYDDLLYESSEESDYARKKIIKCLEDIGEFYDEVE